MQRATDPGPLTHEALRRQHMADALTLLPDHQDWASWSAERLHRTRQQRLQTLVGLAQERSPWHRRRLAGIDPSAFGESDLASIQPMTKSDLMENWDDIVTDRRLNLDLVSRHLESLNADRYLLDRYHAVASGGSTGQRGVFVYDWQGWTHVYLMLHRSLFAQRDPDLPAPVIATVAGDRASHIGSAIQQTFFDHLASHRFPVTLPLEQIVRGLNRVQPTHLGGYSSALNLMVHEARAGRLKISPSQVISAAEPLLPETRVAFEETWGATVNNLWGCSEGARAASCPHGQGMHLSDDLIIVEPVDARGRPVPPGVPSAKIYLTNLYNHALPLIRYEITDEMTFLDGPCSCGSAHRRIDDIQGRTDDTFSYANGIGVHPHLFRSALGREQNIIEYQVRQTLRGAAIALRCGGSIDAAGLRSEIADGLSVLGLEDPHVSIDTVERFQRLESGKFKRFVPLN